MKNNQIFRQRMGALGAENTQLKSNLEEARKESAAISEERDALKTATTTEPPASSEPLAQELEQLRQEKAALEQALQEEQEKQPVQVPAPTPDTSDLESRLVGCSQLPNRRIFLTKGLQAALSQERDQLLAEKETWNKPSSEATEGKAAKDEWESEKADLVKGRDEALSQAKVAPLHTLCSIVLISL